MRILVGGEVFLMQEVGGISRIYRELLPRLRRMAGVSEVVLYLPGPLPVSQPVNGLADHVFTGQLREDRRPFRLRKLLNKRLLSRPARWLFERRRSDVYLPSYYSVGPVNVPSVCFVYDMTHERFPEGVPCVERDMFLDIKRSAVRLASLCLCISEQTKADLVEAYGVDPSACFVVPLGGGERGKGVEDAGAPPQAGPIRFLYVGDWQAPYKNFDFLLDSLSCWQESSAEAGILHVVSRGASSPDERITHQRKCACRIEYHENADDRFLDEMYASSHVFLYPSLWEGFGIPLVEALSHGAAVACSDIPVFREIGGNAVEYFDPCDTSSFCRAVSSAFATSDVSAARQSRRAFSAQYTWDRCAEIVFRHLKDAIA